MKEKIYLNVCSLPFIEERKINLNIVSLPFIGEYDGASVKAEKKILHI